MINRELDEKLKQSKPEKHVHEWRIGNPKFNYCKCGAILIKKIGFHPNELKELEKLLETPGSIWCY